MTFRVLQCVCAIIFLTAAAPPGCGARTDAGSLLIHDARGVLGAPAHWEGREWTNLSLGIASVVLAGIGDESIRDAARRNRTDDTDRLSRAVRPFGDVYAFGTIGAFYIAGSAAHDPEARAVGIDGVGASLLAAGMISPALKLALGRSRPSQTEEASSFHPFSGHSSFPSGHTTESFALASVISGHTRSPRLKIAAYGIASLVGYSRVNDDAHFASDVLAGALIGTAVGRAVVRINGRERALAAPAASP